MISKSWSYGKFIIIFCWIILP